MVNYPSWISAYSRVTQFFSAVICVEIKSLIRNRTITKCFSFCENNIFYFDAIACGTILFSNTLCIILLYLIPQYYVFDLFWLKRVVETCTKTKFLLVLVKFFSRINLFLKSQTRHRFFYKCALVLFIVTGFT